MFGLLIAYFGKFMCAKKRLSNANEIVNGRWSRGKDASYQSDGAGSNLGSDALVWC
jgi:hypothetical protein